MYRIIEIVLAVMLLISGGIVICWPHIRGAELEKASSQAVDTFIDALYIPDTPENADIHRENEELYKAMQNYNRQIYEEHQSELKDPWSYETQAVSLSDYGIEDGVIGVINIESLDLEMPIYFGASNENMAKGAAVLGQTSLPTGDKNCNCVIAGHRGWSGAPYFRYIDQLQEGDEVLITNLWETMSYTVSEIKVIEPNDIKEIFIRDGKDMITLLTCHPYASGGRYRYLVFCERTEE